MTNERDHAREIAEQWLDGKMNHLVQMVPGDPDCDACVLARQFVRISEALDAKVKETFQPNEKTKAILARTGMTIPDELMTEFFALWETEDDPRKAGSIIAHRLILYASRIAIFGAKCAGLEPTLEAWLGSCEMDFVDSVAAVEEAFRQGASEKR